MDITHRKKRAYRPRTQYPVTTRPLFWSCPARERSICFCDATRRGRHVYTLSAHASKCDQIRASIPLQSQNLHSPQSCATWVSQRVPKSVGAIDPQVSQSERSYGQGAHEAPPARDTQHSKTAPCRPNGRIGNSGACPRRLTCCRCTSSASPSPIWA